MNAKSEETKNMTSDAAPARGEGACCGGSARNAAPDAQTRPRPDAEQQPDAIRETEKGKSKGCCCSAG